MKKVLLPTPLVITTNNSLTQKPKYEDSLPLNANDYKDSQITGLEYPGEVNNQKIVQPHIDTDALVTQ